MTPETRTEAKRAGKPLASKTEVMMARETAIDALTGLSSALRDIWVSGCGRPDYILVRTKTFVWLRRPYMTKRGFRRWRAKMLVQVRNAS